MPIYTSASDSEITTSRRLRPVHAVFGGGRVANVLLWEDKWVSAALTAGMSLIWFLFEVVEYNFVTLFCQISVTAMLLLFIWCRVAESFNWPPPPIPSSILDRSTFQEIAMNMHARFKPALSKLIAIACGQDPALFILAIFFLYILSVIGNYFTFLNFLYLGYICLQTLPFLYDRYEEEVDFYAGRLIREVKKTYRRFDSSVLNKIPRVPAAKDKKIR